MPSASVRAHAALAFANPLGEADVDAALAALRVPDGGVVLETGCGAAELLLRVLERHPGARGVGVDPDVDWLARARDAAAARLPGRAVTVLGGDDRAGALPGGHDVALVADECAGPVPGARGIVFVAATAEAAGLRPGAYDVVINVAASHAHGGYPVALERLAALVRPGGQLLLGEGFWVRTPTPAFLAALGGATEDELGTLGDLLAAAGGAGLFTEHRAVASPADWARYEEGLAAAAEREGDPEALAYAAAIRDRRALPEGRDTLGFALLVLRREDTPLA